MMRLSSLVGLLAFMLSASAAHAQSNALEAAVKANFLYKFADFVTWPAEALPDGAFNVCIIGADPFGSALDDAVKDKSAVERRIVIVRSATLKADLRCQIAFLSIMDAQSHDVARAGHVLTVTDGATKPGIIHFVIKDNRVRFEIDDQGAADSGLSISSKLLSLALAVKPRT